MNVNQAQKQTGAPTASDNRVCITTNLPDDEIEIQFVPYVHGADSSLEYKKRRIDVGSTSKTTSAERNQKSR